ncbi:universal stress protein [Mobilicoccus pelagius]|uniref:UspA domain-containing protein n=1 Tax=Mobilicoccus pelagius NBRC 104925 TaxID=1089455 RepID=H5UUJ8_9MICO|nr:universal stress protein [Mobilicoccus pelagius]GAB49406.1 hypothetical protein MOPEL_130_00130 [Mobilicoccus pelagius NBRC 104925]
MTDHIDTNGRVLVGYDGTSAAHHAVLWAAEEAVHRQQPLVVLMAHDILPTGTVRSGAAAAASVAVPTIQEADRARLDALEVELGGSCLDLDMSTEYVVGPAAPHLLARTAEPGLVVLGGRSRGLLGTSILGGVADAVVTGARGPVAIVPECDAAGDTVVVGIDDDGASAAALRYAYAEAQATGTSLELLHCVDLHPEVPTTNALAVAPPAGQDVVGVAREDLHGVVATVRRWGDVEVTGRVELAPSHRALVAASGVARLVVVGTRGRGNLAGLVLGSTSRQLVRSARGPVVVVPPVEE